MPSRAEDLFNELRAKTPAERTAHVEGWIDNHAMETEYLDFKNSGDEKDNERTWSKALSSFGNTEGGLLVWGIDARPQKVPNLSDRAIDCANAPKPLLDTKRHIQLLKDKLRDSINEPIHGIDYIEVSSSKLPPPGGYVISYVPEGKNKPYRAEHISGRPYYQRIGDRNEIISHNILRSLFYPRITPHILPRMSLGEVKEGNPPCSVLTFMFGNNGKATAREVAIMFEFNRRIVVGRPAPTDGFLTFPPSRKGVAEAFQFTWSQPLHPGYTSYGVHFQLKTSDPDLPSNLRLWLTVFANDQQPRRFQHQFNFDQFDFGLEETEMAEVEIFS
jgi:hypothetical protein